MSWPLDSQVAQVNLTIGRISRTFSTYLGSVPPALRWVRYDPLDKKGGYILRSVENGTVIYTHHSRDGDELRFAVASGYACGRYYGYEDEEYKTQCAKISRWRSAEGVEANFLYNRRSEHHGLFGENELIKVSNSLGLELILNYVRHKDSGNHTLPVYSVSSAEVRSHQAGYCTGQITCAKTVLYSYIVTPPTDPNILGITVALMTDFYNVAGERISYQYYRDANTHGGLLKSIRHGANPNVDIVHLTRQYGYNGPVTQFRNADGAVWSYAATTDQAGVRTVTRTGPSATVRRYEFDNRGHLSKFTDELDYVTRFRVDPYGRRDKETRHSGAAIEFSFDERGNALSTTYSPPGGNPEPIITIRATYAIDCTNPKICNKPVTVTDARQQVTEFAYDPAHGGTISITPPRATASAPRPQTRISYTQVLGAYVLDEISTCASRDAETETCAGTSDETKTKLNYGYTHLQPLSVLAKSGDGTVQETQGFSYDVFGNLTEHDGPLASSADLTRNRYDYAGRLVGRIGPDPDGGEARKHHAQRFVYGTNGQIAAVETAALNSQSDGDWNAFSPIERIEMSYDTSGRKVKERLVAGGVVQAIAQYSHDGFGRPVCAARRMNPAVFSSLPASACDAGTAGAFGPDRITKQSYDKVGQLTQIQSAYGLASAPVDELTQTYTPHGKVATATDADGNRTTYEYDAHDRLIRIRYPSPTADGESSATDYEQMGYDPNGNVTSLRLRDGQPVTLGYDNLNRLILKDLPGAEPSVTYQYDNLGRVKQVSGADSVSYAYDALGRVTSATDAFGAKSYQYDAAGRRSRMTWPDGFHVTYAHDVTGNLTAIKENGTAALATYAYDDFGRRTGIVRGNGTSASYAYDAASRLQTLSENVGGAATTHDLTTAFAYNPAGQIRSRERSNDLYAFWQYYNVDRPYTDNGLNQYLTSGGVTLGYDGRGNLTASGTKAYGYTSENMLAAGPNQASLTYNAQGQLASSQSASIAVRRFEYDGSDLIGEYSGANVLLRRYVHGPGADEPLVWYEGSGTGHKRWLHADERGSVIAVTNAAGNVLGLNRYDEYGIPETGNMGRFQYTGQSWLPELEMYNYKARIYSPTLGRFMQTDPIGYGDGMNLYAYVGSDPMNLVDPTGLHNCGRYDNGDDCVVIGNKPKPPLYGPGAGAPNGGAFNYYPRDFGGAGALASMLRNAVRNMRNSLKAASQKSWDGIKEFYCSSPPLGVSFAGRGYDVLGGGLVTDFVFDPRSGRLGASYGIDVGVGFGAAGKWTSAKSSGMSATAGRSVPDGWSGSVGVNANAQLGPLAAGVGTTLIGRKGPGFNGVSAGLRPGSTGTTINANLGVRGGYGGQIVPACGK